ncbi:MAG: hypothetical protein JWQ38_188 [Flavipsychrobacter sp.]|nr:hypothetical protein [Flavipsychrobacter sp.]
MFVLSSDITIGKFHFSGINNVLIRRSIYSIEETATITIPSIARIIRNGKVQPELITTGRLFTEGDPVIIKLGYNNALQTEFRGFVKRQNLKIPLEVECEGYSWQLRRNKIKEVSGEVTIKELLKNAVSGINSRYRISVECKVDITLNNVHFKNESGFDIINSISKYTDGNLTCFFIRPDTLWCGLLYTECAKGNNILSTPQIKYRLGYNVIKDNSLKERLTDSDPTQVIYSKKLPKGEKISGTSDAFRKYVRTHNKILNQIKEAPVLKKLANEKAYQLNYIGYEGTINTFLEPYAIPGYEAFIVDSRYPERNAIYLIESVETTFGISGARRKVEVGIKFSSAKIMLHE